MAVCEERLGNGDQAIELYQQFIDAADAPEDRRAHAEYRIEEIRGLQEPEVSDPTVTAPEPEEVDVGETSEPQEQEAPETPPPSNNRDGRTLSPAAFYVMLGFTSASAIAMAALGGVTLARHQEFLSLYRGEANSADLQDTGRNLAWGTNMLIGITAASAAITLVLGLVTDWRRGDRTAGASIIMSARPGGGALGLSGRF